MLRLVHVDSVLIMSDDLEYEHNMCEFIRQSGEFQAITCIEVSREFLAPPTKGEAQAKLASNPGTEGFRLYRFAQLFGRSELTVGSFDSNFDRIAQLFRESPFDRFFDFFGYYWTPCMNTMNPLDPNNTGIFETMPYDPLHPKMFSKIGE